MTAPLNYAVLLLISLIALLPFGARQPSTHPATAHAMRLPRSVPAVPPLAATDTTGGGGSVLAVGRQDDGDVEVDDEITNPIGYETPGVTDMPSPSPDVDASYDPSPQPEASEAPDSESESGSGSGTGGGKRGTTGTDGDTNASPSPPPPTRPPPSPSPREFPCRVKFSLVKRYTAFPDFVYECTKQHQFRADVFPAACPDAGWLRLTDTCVRQGTEECQFAPKQKPQCVTPACPDAQYRLINSVATCLKCPNTYTLFQEDGIYKCSKFLVEQPVCASPDQTFDSTVGQCV